MEDKLCFVQFLHPGGEHRCGPDRLIPWNAAKRNAQGELGKVPNHARKFLLNPGRFLRSADQQCPERGDITFWGEWEAQSEQVEDYGKGSSPASLQRPYYVVPENYEGHQNTDPFVFGETFLYTSCQQIKKGNKTQLCHLAPGSVILFGSKLGGQFVLDTIFVVSDKTMWHRSLDDLGREKFDGTAYWEVTARAWYPEHPDAGSCISSPSRRLYRSATLEHPWKGLYSFFPCLPHGERATGFERPVIDLPPRSTRQCSGVSN
jgi:hypothetical protein